MRAVSGSLINKRNMLGVVISGICMGFVLMMFTRVLQMSGLVIDTEHRASATLEALLGVAIGGLTYMFFYFKITCIYKKRIRNCYETREKRRFIEEEWIEVTGCEWNHYCFRFRCW